MENDARVQSAHAAAANEIEQLKAMAAALREQLERAQFDKENALQLEKQGARGEIAQLQEAISAMRQEMERQRA
jgi:HAMP domain-containing protein